MRIGCRPSRFIPVDKLAPEQFAAAFAAIYHEDPQRLGLLEYIVSAALVNQRDLQQERLFQAHKEHVLNAGRRLGIWLNESDFRNDRRPLRYQDARYLMEQMGKAAAVVAVRKREMAAATPKDDVVVLSKEEYSDLLNQLEKSRAVETELRADLEFVRQQLRDATVQDTPASDVVVPPPPPPLPPLSLPPVPEREEFEESEDDELPPPLPPMEMDEGGDDQGLPPSRSALLDAIRDASNKKRLRPPPPPPPKEDKSSGGDLAKAITKALANRRGAISPQEEDSAWDAEDDWEYSSAHIGLRHFYRTLGAYVNQKLDWDPARRLFVAGKACASCKKRSTRHEECPCGKAVYCGERCQARDWPRHGAICSARRE